MTTNLLSLNNDILLLLVSFLSRGDALKFSLTAKEIYPFAIRQVPTIAPCHNAEQLTKAHAYMLSDIPNRARRLVDLTIAYYRFDSESAILAKDLLTEAAMHSLLFRGFNWSGS
ncbi:hypothetical protein A0H81_14249 [Grifola frondosa]|uniref:Uncharacterized protein n=1 Tax=Grifola frondosa TaxID=5627 RepID=A0A1C7LM40_GRIFR|nr:hypothetical protein A0H81_14249 [Grifola frondosa]